MLNPNSKWWLLVPLTGAITALVTSIYLFNVALVHPLDALWKNILSLALAVGFFCVALGIFRSMVRGEF